MENSPQESAVNVKREPIDLDAEGFSDKRFVSIKEPHLPPMRLKVHHADKHGRTHKLKSQEHSWEGTEAEFRATFDAAPHAEKKKAAAADDEAKKAIAEARKSSAAEKAAKAKEAKENKD